MKELKIHFLAVSPDKGRNIRRDDLLKVVKACNQNPSETDYKALLAETKLNKKVSLTFDEVLNLCTRLWKGEATRKSANDTSGKILTLHQEESTGKCFFQIEKDNYFILQKNIFFAE